MGSLREEAWYVATVGSRSGWRTRRGSSAVQSVRAVWGTDEVTRGVLFYPSSQRMNKRTSGDSEAGTAREEGELHRTLGWGMTK